MSKIKICLSGIDGSGKTTHLHTLIRKLGELGFHCKYISLRGMYFRFVSLPLLYLCRILGYEEKIVAEGNERYVRHPNLIHSSAIKLLWTTLFLIDMYLLAVLRGYFWSRAEVILCDRYMADSIVDLMVALKDDTVYSGRIGKFFLFLTRPDMILLLDVDEEEAFKRKKDMLNLEQLGLRRNLYRKMASELGIPIIDASRPFTVVHKDILNHVKNIVPRFA